VAAECHIWTAIDQWLVNYRATHPDDDRGDVELLLDETVYPEASSFDS